MARYTRQATSTETSPAAAPLASIAAVGLKGAATRSAWAPGFPAAAVPDWPASSAAAVAEPNGRRERKAGRAEAIVGLCRAIMVSPTQTGVHPRASQFLSPERNIWCVVHMCGARFAIDGLMITRGPDAICNGGSCGMQRPSAGCRFFRNRQSIGRSRDWARRSNSHLYPCAKIRLGRRRETRPIHRIVR